MKTKRTSRLLPRHRGFRRLLAACRQFKFEPHDIARWLDERGHYKVPLDREFPFLIKLFHYDSLHHTRGATWHERLELFLPLDGPACVRMGDDVVTLERGDLLVVDNLKLHHVVDFPGFDTRVIVISFLPEFVYSLGSPLHDYTFLLPFNAKVEKRPHVLRGKDALSDPVYLILGELLECYFRRPVFYQAGCKALFLRLLYDLARHFRTAEVLRSELVQQQERAQQLRRLLDHVSEHYAERLALNQAAAMVGMSQSKFIQVFKRVAGMTFIAYVIHLRLSNAARLLKETTWSVAEVASHVGFTDQSYFDRRFRLQFGKTPREFRAQMFQEPPPPERRARAKSSNKSNEHF